MKRVLLTTALLGLVVLFRIGSAHADYAFTFDGSAQAQNGNTYTYDFTGTLTSSTTTPDSNGYVVVTGGTLTATGTAYNGITFTVAPLSASIPGYTASLDSPTNGYATYTVRNTNGDDLFHDNVIAPGVNPLLPATQAGLDLLGTYNGVNIVISLSSSGPGQYAIQDDNTTSTKTPGWNDPYMIGWSYVTLENGTADATPTPIPAAAWLLGSGLTALGYMRRRFFRA
jgi:hypothetical protein